MRTRYRWQSGRFVDRDGMPLLNQAERAGEPCAPMVVRDVPEYESPVTGEPIGSRSTEREHMKKHDALPWGDYSVNARQDSQYGKQTMKRVRKYYGDRCAISNNRRFAKKRGLPHVEDL